MNLDSIEIVPEFLEFIGPFTEDVTKEFVMRSAVTEKIEFFIKTTAPTLYRVFPRSGILDEHGILTVFVQLVFKELERIQTYQHKFKILFHPKQEENDYNRLVGVQRPFTYEKKLYSFVILTPKESRSGNRFLPNPQSRLSVRLPDLQSFGFDLSSEQQNVRKQSLLSIQPRLSICLPEIETTKFNAPAAGERNYEEGRREPTQGMEEHKEEQDSNEKVKRTKRISSPTQGMEEHKEEQDLNEKVKRTKRISSPTQGMEEHKEEQDLNEKVKRTKRISSPTQGMEEKDSFEKVRKPNRLSTPTEWIEEIMEGEGKGFRLIPKKIAKPKRSTSGERRKFSHYAKMIKQNKAMDPSNAKNWKKRESLTGKTHKERDWAIDYMHQSRAIPPVIFFAISFFVGSIFGKLFL